jgi:2-polyprenyl-6-methoxyphenol hydroxylase-like FAD-dependent oxidoreductase
MASSNTPAKVTIIGAGLAGVTLALSLHKQGISSKIYELRGPDYTFGGAIMLSPNALRVLDSLDVYSRIRNIGFNFETLTFMTDSKPDTTTGTYYFGHEKLYGYKALRIYRRVLLNELRKVAEERGIPILYHRKFTNIVSESAEGVTFAFDENTVETTPILIGTDGIHSKVRKYLHPEIEPKYAGLIGLTYAFPSSTLRLPASQPNYASQPVSIHGPLGAYVLAPQNHDGSEMFAGRQFGYPAQGRDGWDALLKSKAELVGMLQGDMESWSDLVRSGLEQASSAYAAETLNIWPFHSVPHFESWASEMGKVVIIGDAAHAIPPTAGQGANQAFEDAFSLAFLLKNVDAVKGGLEVGLARWRAYRQARIDGVMEVNDKMNSLRLTEEELKGLPEEKIWRPSTDEMEGAEMMRWLYEPEIEDEMVKVLNGEA